jgi:hypothetical protein
MHKTLIIGFAIGLMACEGGGGAPGGAGSAAPAGGKATTSLTKAQLDAAYAAANPDKYDESVAAATAKLGKPAASDATSSTWYGVDGTKCYKLLLTKSKGHEVGTTDNASCGLK